VLIEKNHTLLYYPPCFILPKCWSLASMQGRAFCAWWWNWFMYDNDEKVVGVSVSNIIYFYKGMSVQQHNEISDMLGTHQNVYITCQRKYQQKSNKTELNKVLRFIKGTPNVTLWSHVRQLEFDVLDMYVSTQLPQSALGSIPESVFCGPHKCTGNGRFAKIPVRFTWFTFKWKTTRKAPYTLFICNNVKTFLYQIILSWKRKQKHKYSAMKIKSNRDFQAVGRTKSMHCHCKCNLKIVFGSVLEFCLK